MIALPAASAAAMAGNTVMDDVREKVPAGTPRDGDDGEEPPQRLLLDILVEDGDWRAFEPVENALTAVAAALARHLDLSGVEAAVALSSDERVRALNRTYRGQDKPTNVLSFPVEFHSDTKGGIRHLGDIALAVETITGEAAAERKMPRHHLQHLLIHGLLHLLGYEHDTERGARQMERIEVEILGELGVPDPYAEPA